MFGLGFGFGLSFNNSLAYELPYVLTLQSQIVYDSEVADLCAVLRGKRIQAVYGYHDNTLKVPGADGLKWSPAPNEDCIVRALARVPNVKPTFMIALDDTNTLSPECVIFHVSKTFTLGKQAPADGGCKQSVVASVD